jgi:predicted RNA-binding Zn-ribbon protein involved in translation (DUF1610 family)
LKIKANCPTCGDQTLEPEEVTVVWYPRRSVLSYYKFNCIQCGELVCKGQSPAVLLELRRAECLLEIINLPAEVMEERPLLAALTEDDILDFMLEIQGEDNLSALA